MRMIRPLLQRLIVSFTAAALALSAGMAHAAHGFAQYGDLKYPAGFQHFDYVNLQAVSGGTLNLQIGRAHV